MDLEKRGIYVQVCSHTRFPAHRNGKLSKKRKRRYTKDSKEGMKIERSIGGTKDKSPRRPIYSGGNLTMLPLGSPVPIG
jgi:hypothetical protein